MRTVCSAGGFDPLPYAPLVAKGRDPDEQQCVRAFPGGSLGRVREGICVVVDKRQPAVAVPHHGTVRRYLVCAVYTERQESALGATTHNIQ